MSPLHLIFSNCLLHCFLSKYLCDDAVNARYPNIVEQIIVLLAQVFVKAKSLHTHELTNIYLKRILTMLSELFFFFGCHRIVKYEAQGRPLNFLRS